MPEEDKQITEEPYKVNAELPAWLKPEIFEQVLKENVDGYESIKSFNAIPGTRPGDNYASFMLRVELEVKLSDESTKVISYMLKIPHNSETYNETLGKTNVFEIERNMFTIYVEEFKELYRKAGLELEFGAKCYKLAVPHDHVLLEDLKPRGFQPTNRQAGLDKEHVLSVLKKLAQWHAASAVRVDTKGPYPPEQTIGLFSEDQKAFMYGFTDGMVKIILRSLATIEGHEEYYDDVKNMEGHIFENIIEMAKVDPDEFNVLNHGDCWLSNIMFQYDKLGKLQETYFVDYQIPKYGTVAHDLLYFLISSPKLEVKLNEFDYFVKYYHDELTKHLKLLNYAKKLPTLIDIHLVLIKYGIWGYATACGVMAGSLLEPTETAKFENIFADTPEADAFKMLLFSGKMYKEHIKVILPWLKNRGALQCNRVKANKKSNN